MRETLFGINAMEGVRAQTKSLARGSQLGDERQLLEGFLMLYQLWCLVEISLLVLEKLLFSHARLVLILAWARQPLSFQSELIPCADTLSTQAGCAILFHFSKGLGNSVVTWSWYNGAAVDAAWHRNDLLLQLQPEHVALRLGLESDLVLLWAVVTIVRDFHRHGGLFLLGRRRCSAHCFHQHMGWLHSLDTSRDPFWQWSETSRLTRYNCHIGGLSSVSRMTMFLLFLFFFAPRRLGLIVVIQTQHIRNVGANL
mmetsp:Transcript_20627/g.34427  ORF Transcript_20627/g.34427 Transcript_20627/m.34427 type:complete len:255 (-) Transcript_20627:524-1288(-)